MADYEIAKVLVSSISAGVWADISWYGIFPSSIPGYDPLLMISILSIVSVIFILNKRKKK